MSVSFDQLIVSDRPVKVFMPLRVAYCFPVNGGWSVESILLFDLAERRNWQIEWSD